MLQMALIGYQHQKQTIDQKIHEIEARLKGKSPVSAAAPPTDRRSIVRRVSPSPLARARQGGRGASS